MLQETVARAAQAKGLEVAAPSFVCALDHAAEVESQSRAEGYDPLRVILEPCPRNTAPVASIIALEIARIDPEGLILLLPADHHVHKPEVFWQSVKGGVEAAKQSYLTTFGIKPTRAETGYGYIRAANNLDDTAVHVDGFYEKPDQKTAQTYIEAGDYFWNAGIFLFSPKAMIAAFEAHADDILKSSEASIAKARRKNARLYLDPSEFAACRSESIDYAIMEKTDKVAMVPNVDMGWNDIGSWEVICDKAIEDLAALADDSSVAALGDVISVDCKTSYLRSEGPLIAAIGVEDLVIVAMQDAVLITKKDQTQHVKTIVNTLKADSRKDLL
jgi:mannose-1-phosphate guanylyltransferase/mannose-6-phosphate isomerase